MQRSDRLLGILLQLSDRERRSPPHGWPSVLKCRSERSTGTWTPSASSVFPSTPKLGAMAASGWSRATGCRRSCSPKAKRSRWSSASRCWTGSRPRPHSADLARAESKLLNVLPPELQQTLRNAQRIIGFESTAVDAFHVERSEKISAPGEVSDRRRRGGAGSVSRRHPGRQRVRMRYQSPYRREAHDSYEATPVGLFWDRNCWYLVGTLGDGESRTWRADRVLDISIRRSEVNTGPGADISAYLDRSWLAAAMETWRIITPGKIAIRLKQAKRLKGLVLPAREFRGAARRARADDLWPE